MRTCICLAAVLAACVACNPPTPTAASAAGTAATSAVGPLPGNGELPPRTNPLDGNAAARQSGRALFVAFNCSGCHGGHAGGGMGPSLRDAVWIYGGSDGQIFDSIAQGRANGMPAWGTLLPEPQIWLLTAYLKSLRTPDEPEPPQW